MSKVAQNTLIYTLGNIVPQAVGFLLLPIYTSYLSPGDFGIVGSMQALQTIIIILFTICFERAVLRLYWDYHDEDRKKDFLGTLTIAITVISVIMMILLLLFHSLLEKIYSSIAFYPYYFYSIITVFFSSFTLIPKQFLQLKEKSTQFVVLSLCQFLARVGFVIWFVVGIQSGAIGYLKGMMFGEIIMFPIFIYLSWKTINIKLDFKILKNVLPFALPMIPPLIVSWVVQMSNRIFLERYTSLDDVGLFSFSVRIADLVGVFASSLLMAYSPNFFKLANSDDLANAKGTIKKYNHLFLYSVIIICFFIAFFSKEVLALFINKRYESTYLFISLIAFSNIFGSAVGITSLYFQQSKKMKQNMVISFTVAGINILLNLIFISHFGIYGAIAAQIITLAYCFFISYEYTKRNCFFVPINWRYVAPLTISLFLLAFISHFFFDKKIILSLIIKVLFSILLIAFVSNKYYSQIKYFFKKA